MEEVPVAELQIQKWESSCLRGFTAVPYGTFEMQGYGRWKGYTTCIA